MVTDSPWNTHLIRVSANDSLELRVGHVVSLPRSTHVPLAFGFGGVGSSPETGKTLQEMGVRPNMQRIPQTSPKLGHVYIRGSNV